jgi:tRNA 2-selenouridine synthase
MQASVIQIQDVINRGLDSFVLIDVRSEGEYQKGHISGALNIPLLSNTDRESVGITYKNEGRKEAVALGLRLVGPRMEELYRKYAIHFGNKPVVFYCWRGGLRSEIASVICAWGGHKVSKINGGYKSFRNHIHQTFETPYQFIVLSGKTGSGKTEILHLLKEKKEQIIDLEGLANHRGSAFGALGMPEQPSTEMFENLLGLTLLSINPNKKTWVENESRLIGTCYLPTDFWNNLSSSKIISAVVDDETRINRLLEDYGHFPVEVLIERTEVLRKKLGGQHANTAVEALKTGDLKLWLKTVLVYYDKTYGYGEQKHKERVLNFVEFDWSKKDESAQKLIQSIN